MGNSALNGLFWHLAANEVIFKSKAATTLRKRHIGLFEAQAQWNHLWLYFTSTYKFVLIILYSEFFVIMLMTSCSELMYCAMMHMAYTHITFLIGVVVQLWGNYDGGRLNRMCPSKLCMMQKCVCLWEPYHPKLELSVLCDVKDA